MPLFSLLVLSRTMNLSFAPSPSKDLMFLTLRILLVRLGSYAGYKVERGWWWQLECLAWSAARDMGRVSVCRQARRPSCTATTSTASGVAVDVPQRCQQQQEESWPPGITAAASWHVYRCL